MKSLSSSLKSMDTRAKHENVKSFWPIFHSLTMTPKWQFIPTHLTIKFKIFSFGGYYSFLWFLWSFFHFFADLCVGLLSVLTDIIWRITISWRAGNIACKVIRFSQVCVTYSSTYVLVAMSIDRYDAITHPMNFSKSCKSSFGYIYLRNANISYIST